MSPFGPRRPLTPPPPRPILPPMRIFQPIAASAVLLLLAACSTPPLPPPKPIDSATYDAFLASAKDPRFREGITTYRTPDGPYYKDANRVRPERYNETSFLSKPPSLLPLFAAKPRTDDDLAVLLDTSARASWTRFDLASLLDFALAAPPDGEHPDHVSLDIPGYAGIAQRIRLGDFMFELPVVYLLVAHGGLGPLARQETVPPGERRDPDVVLGWAALENIAYLRIDYSRRILRFSASSTDYRTPATHETFLSLPLVAWHGRPAVEAVIDESDPLSCVIDTAGDYDLSIPTGTSPLLDPPARLLLGGREIPLSEVRTHHDLGLPKDFPPRIGARLLSRYTVVFDKKHNRLLLEIPRTAAAPDAGDESPAPDARPAYRNLRNAPALR